jgi:AcrR family transcriptional regulator
MTTGVGELGRRDRKKAATRSAISAAALRLFLEHGYQAVSLRQIADEADVAVATVFKHFSGKEALVFDEDLEIEHSLVAAIDQRAAGQSILDALEHHMLRGRAFGKDEDPEFARFLTLIAQTPQLEAYWRDMSLRHTAALAAAIRRAARDRPGQITDTVARAIAHMVLEATHIAQQSPDPAVALREIFQLLRAGWPY